jgi:Protein of unknown function (DUF2442)
MTSLTLTLAIEPLAVDVAVTDTILTIKLTDDRILSVPLNWYPRLLNATPKERENWELLGDGYAIEWVDLDEHIGIEGLLAGRRSGESQQSFDRWLATRIDRGNNMT